MITLITKDELKVKAWRLTSKILASKLSQTICERELAQVIEEIKASAGPEYTLNAEFDMEKPEANK